MGLIESVLWVLFVGLIIFAFVRESSVKSEKQVLATDAFAPLIIFLFFVTPTLVFTYFENRSGFWLEWSPYFSIVVICALVLFFKATVGFRRFPKRFPINKLLFAGIAACLFAFTLISSRQLEKLHASDTLEVANWRANVIALVTIALVSVCVISLGSSLQKRRFQLDWLLQFPLIVLIVTSILSAPWGNTLRGDANKSVALLVTVTIVITWIMWRCLVVEPGINDGLFKSPLRRPFYKSVLIGSSIALALRIDAISSTPASYQHISYFSGVVQTMRSGGMLLWDTPSQYGYLNLVLSSWIPISDSRTAFLVFQALLLIFVYCAVLALLSQRFFNQWIFLTAGTIFLIALFFASPRLIGAQAFPSTSVVRFGPSMLLLAWLSSQKLIHNIHSRKTRLITAVVFAIGVVWSAESMVYIVFIFGTWNLAAFALSETARKRDVLRNVLAPIIGYSIALSFFLVAFVSIKRMIVNHHFPDWSLFLLAASKYAQGFYSAPQVILSPVWLFVGLLAFVVAIFTCETKQADIDEILERAVLGAVAGGLLGWGTYYVGRSLPENFVALYPQFVICALLTISVLKRTSQGSSALLPGLRNWLKQSTLVFCVVAMSTVTIAIVGQVGFVSNIANFRFLFQEVKYEESIYDPGDLSNVLTLTRLKLVERGVTVKLPIISEDREGFRLPLDDDLEAFYDVEKSWLPVPLALLEEPIPTAIRRELIGRFVTRSRTNGVLVSNKLTSYPGRFAEWLKVLQPYYLCQDIVNTSNYQTVYCEFRE